MTFLLLLFLICMVLRSVLSHPFVLLLLAYHLIFGVRRSSAHPPGPFLSPNGRQVPPAIQPPPWTPVYAGGSPSDSAKLWSVDRSPYTSPVQRRSP